MLADQFAPAGDEIALHLFGNGANRLMCNDEATTLILSGCQIEVDPTGDRAPDPEPPRQIEPVGPANLFHPSPDHRMPVTGALYHVGADFGLKHDQAILAGLAVAAIPPPIDIVRQQLQAVLEDIRSNYASNLDLASFTTGEVEFGADQRGAPERGENAALLRWFAGDVLADGGA